MRDVDSKNWDNLFGSDLEPRFRLSAEEAKKCWTPCKHYPKYCIGYCPFCIAAYLQIREDLVLAGKVSKEYGDG